MIAMLLSLASCIAVDEANSTEKVSTAVAFGAIHDTMVHAAMNEHPNAAAVGIVVRDHRIECTLDGVIVSVADLRKRNDVPSDLPCRFEDQGLHAPSQLPFSDSDKKALLLNWELSQYSKTPLSVEEPFRTSVYAASGWAATGFVVQTNALEEQVVTQTANLLADEHYFFSAGHAFLPQKLPCSGVAIVLGWQQDLDSTFSSQQIYLCRRSILHAYDEKNPSANDAEILAIHSLVQTHQEPPNLGFSIAQTPTTPQTAVCSYGHPFTSTMKYSSGGIVNKVVPSTTHPGAISHFHTNLTLYSGNSGSPVFDCQTHHVLGVVVRNPEPLVVEGKERNFCLQGYNKNNEPVHGCRLTRQALFHSSCANLESNALKVSPCEERKHEAEFCVGPVPNNSSLNFRWALLRANPDLGVTRFDVQNDAWVSYFNEVTDMSEILALLKDSQPKQ